jgi:hypothetical protein
VEYTKHSEAPDAFHFWTAVSVVAGALRRRVWIDQRHFQWTPNFYIVFVGPPGVIAKSTSAHIGFSLLKQVDGIKFGPQSLTWQGLTVALEEAVELVQMPADDALIPMSCLTISISELGTFLKPKDTELIDVMVDLWDGQIRTWEHRVKTGDKPSTRIVNPWMNIIGCTTPAWLRANFPAYMIEGGLTSRCIFVYGDAKRQFTAYLSEAIESKEHKAMASMLVEDLKQIAAIAGEYELSREAIEWGTSWYIRHWTNRPKHLTSDRYGGYVARKQTHMHKLAMVIAAAQRNTRLITVEDLTAAERLVSAQEVDLQKVFNTIGATDQSKDETEVVAALRGAGGFSSQKDLLIMVSKFIDRKRFDAAISNLLSMGTIKLALINNSLGYEYQGEAVPTEPKSTSG